jgi:hypothetical protein
MLLAAAHAGQANAAAVIAPAVGPNAASEVSRFELTGWRFSLRSRCQSALRIEKGHDE